MGIGIVQTAWGKVEGIEFDGKYSGITQFRGIPFAAPPLGKLRWMPPEKPASWSGVRKCDKYAPCAIQTFEKTGIHTEDFLFMGLPEMSEDCLYLNVTTPAANKREKLPVYLWLHGGGLTSDCSYGVGNNPQELARKGCVVISPGMRLNVFGNLALPQLTKEYGKSGNYMLMDMLAALDWVTENIENFGGDPGCIATGGESGGTIKTMVMTTCPASKGRIQRMINESGLKWHIKFISREEEEEIGLRFLEYVGIDPDISVDKLHKLDAFEIYRDGVPRVITPNDFVFDGELIPAATGVELLDAYQGETGYINGVNKGEGDIFARSFAGLSDFAACSCSVPTGAPIRAIKNASDFYAHFHNLLGPLYYKYNFRNLVNVIDGNAIQQALILAAHGLTGQEGMNFSRNLMKNRIFGRYMAKKHPANKIFNYLWSYPLPVLPEDKGTERDPEVVLMPHGSEVWFTFAALREGVPPKRPWSKKDFDMAEIASSYWANFIKNGDPNGTDSAGNSLPQWPECREDYGYLDLGKKIEGHTGLSGDLDRLIREFVSIEYKIGPLNDA
jgi:para-nitrobenzyl esterase